MKDHLEKQAIIQDNLEIHQDRMAVLLQDRVATLQDNVLDREKQFVMVYVKIPIVIQPIAVNVAASVQ
jgi:hypothetical protein